MSGIQMALMGSVSSTTSESHTLTTGGVGTAGNRVRGYDLSSSLGSLSPTTTAIGGATLINSLYYDESVPEYYLETNGSYDGGWTSLTIDGTKVLTRASATSYSLNPLGPTSVWAWSTSDTVTTQAFGAAGTSHTVVFT